MKSVMLALAMLGLAPALGVAQPAAGPVEVFLKAADVNDFAAMRSVMDPKSTGFLSEIRNCYLRRVYSNNETHELVAAWMCAEALNRSRVVLADVGLTAAGKVAVSVRSDGANNRPAPPRTGSAFAN